MKTLIKSLIKQIVKAKVYAERSLSYAGLMNSMVLIFLATSELRQYIDFSIKKYYPILIIIFITLVILIGYIEDKLGVWREEVYFKASRNPRFDKLNNKLNRIEDILEHEY